MLISAEMIGLVGMVRNYCSKIHFEGEATKLVVWVMNEERDDARILSKNFDFSPQIDSGGVR